MFHPAPILQRRVEATAMLVAAIAAYDALGLSWSFFAVCFFLPDLAILFYWINPRLGGAAYNLTHFFLWPLLIGGLGALLGAPAAWQVALVWTAHIAFDRAIGWGLKYEQSFCHTDMGLKSLSIGPRCLMPEPGR